MESRTLGLRPTLRTQKNPSPRPRTALPRTDHGQTLSRPRTGSSRLRTKNTSASVLQKRKAFKKIFQAISNKKRKKSSNFFSGDLQKRITNKVFAKFSAWFLAFFNKILTLQKVVLSSSRGQSNFWGLEASRPRTSKCILEAKNVLNDSTSVGGISIGREAVLPLPLAPLMTK